MGRVRASEEIYLGACRLKVSTQGGEIVGGEDAVRVDEYEEIARCAVHAVITGRGAPLILLIVIRDGDLTVESGHYIAASDRRSILDDNTFKAFVRLLTKAL